MTAPQTTQAPKARNAFLDVARFFGLALVYYGHVVEQAMVLKNPAAAQHYKFVYSFHMIFFFLVAGFVFNPAKLALPFWAYVKRQAASRLVPYAFFSLVLAASTLVFTGHYFYMDLGSPSGYLAGVLSTAMGFPLFNIPLWFLAALFSLELTHRIVGPWLRSDLALCIAAVIAYSGGYLLNLNTAFFPERNFWIINEVPVIYAFYLAGVWLRRRAFLQERASSLKSAVLAAICLAVVCFTYDLNQGPFRMFQAVVILLGAHGHFLLFPLTALAGSIFLLAFAKLFENIRLLSWLGQNGLILFCLNGVFYHYVNVPMAEWFMAETSGSGFAVFVWGAAVTFASLLFCVPFAVLFERYLPQLAGRPGASGPILPPFVRA